jgi:hypothetical protein
MKDEICKYISVKEFASEGYKAERIRSSKQWYCRLKGIISDDVFKANYLLNDELFDIIKENSNE